MSRPAGEDPRVERLRAHVDWLADPARAGRETGTPAERAVAEDLARRFAGAGLDPAGTEGFLQPVPVVRVRAGPGTLAVTAPGGERWTAPEGSFAVRCPGDADCRIEDRARVARLEAPASPLDTSSAALRLDRLVRESGAEGALVLIAEPDWADALAGLQAPRCRRAGEADPDREDPFVIAVNAASAPAWLKSVRPGTCIEVHGTGAVEVEEATGWNVAGILPGSDPGRAGEAVVLTAHHDHLGTRVIGGRSVVYPGVVDNALSVAELVETARLLTAGPRPPRSIVCLCPTAEETGFLGTRHWLDRPPPGTPRPIANWNHDGASEAWGRAASAVLVSGARFPLTATFAGVAREQGIAVVDNPFPSEGFFFRSDHYVFAEADIAAALVFLGPLYAGELPEWGIARAASYLREAYHQPGDDVGQIVTWEGALQFIDLWAGLARASAAADSGSDM